MLINCKKTCSTEAGDREIVEDINEESTTCISLYITEWLTDLDSSDGRHVGAQARRE